MARRYLCGTPPADCTGSWTHVNFSLTGRKGGSTKTHTTSVDAFRCYRRWLLSQGYEEAGPREFRSPHDGTILVLEKASRFGGRLRPGKAGEKGQGNRYEPESGGGIIF